MIQRFEGYIAQYLGDGLLVYFGYPQAHEDDAQRAVRTGLGVVEAMGTLNTTLARDHGVRLAVRVGIHTGLVVVGVIGGGDRQERLALGATPNLAARLQGQAAPDTVVISATTHQLVQGLFTSQALEPPTLTGLDEPLTLYQVLAASPVPIPFVMASHTHLTPLVGREEELGLLRRRWTQVQEGDGQVVLLSGEAGIGKSRLVRELYEAVESDQATRLVFRCAPSAQQSALYPVIEHLQRLVQKGREETPETQCARLAQILRRVGMPVPEVLPLLTALLSLPNPAGYPLLQFSPEQQKQKTQEALIAWLMAEAVQQPVLMVWEDLHWADPSTLELLGLLQEQAPTVRLLTLLTCRPMFVPPWAPPCDTDPAHLDATDAPAGCGDGAAGGRRQGAAGGGAAADGGPDRWRALVCGRADQDGVGGGWTPGSNRTRRPDRPPGAGHSRDAAGRVAGPAGPTPRGEGRGATGVRARSDVCL